MILTCPECATSYFVDDGKIGPQGRNVRCASCGERWMAFPDIPSTDLGAAPPPPARTPQKFQPAPAAPAPSAALLAAIDEAEPALRSQAGELPKAFRAKQQAQKTVREAAAAGIVWAGMAAMMLTIAGGAYVFRVDVVKLWPQAASAYAAAKVPVNPLGLEFEDVDAKPALRNGQAALVVSGKIRNVQDVAIESPPLRIRLVDAAGKELAIKLADPENARIPPGETRHFSVNLINPPLQAEDAFVTFALDRKVAAKAHGAAKPAEALPLRGHLEEPVAAEPALAAPAAGIIEAQPLPAGAPPALPHG